MTDDRHNDHDIRQHSHVPATGGATSDEATRADREGLISIRDAYLSTDLLRPGPGLWPLGRRARERRVRDRAVAAEARRRRHHIPTAARRPPSARPAGQGFSGVRDTDAASRVAVWRPVERRTHILVITCLAGLVGGVVVAAVWWTRPDLHVESAPATRSPAPESTETPSTAMSSSSAASVNGTAGGSLPARPPIPPGGVDPVTPGHHTP
ncbi:hypothetical protein, partial [Actinophytocola xanthii]|uniref:hypothetical protein n=1 Tax=Actinophytocola xanthii TaxID=1912961 RepID=UPI001E589FD0